MARKSKKNSNNMLFLIGVISLVIVVICIILSLTNSSSGTNEIVSFQLKGSENMQLYVGEGYREPGYIASGSVSGDLNSYVTTDGEVNTGSVGSYDINYKLSYNGAVLYKTRTVVVNSKPVDSQNVVQNGVSDNKNTSNGSTISDKVTTSGVDRIKLTLNGYSEVYLLNGTEYKEPGYKAVSDSGIDVTDKVVVSGNVDVNTAGVYYITYTVSDSSGSSVSLKRKIEVMTMNMSSTVSDKEITNRSVVLKLNTVTDNFSHMILPDGSKVTASTYEYIISNNGTYAFKVYNKYGLMRKYSYVVSNIDKEEPNGSCSGYTKAGKSYIKINSKDNVGILKYVINGIGYTSSDITLNSVVDNPQITIYDKAGNTKTISCKLENQSVYYKSEFSLKEFSSSHGTTFKYWLNVPEGAHDGMPILLYLHGDGEVGNVNRLKSIHQIDYIVNKHNGEKFILVAPVTNVKSWTSGSIPTSLKDLIDTVGNTYSIDKNRIYIIGFSRGATGVWYMVNKYPNYFAAAMPVSNCPPGVSANNFKNTKVRAISGNVGDFEVQCNKCMSSFVNSINSAGGSAEMITHKGAGHTSIITAIDYKDLFEWMLKQKK